ncbi:MAG: DivIVA domain-containing protein [Gemmatimonadota bacterium]
MTLTPLDLKKQQFDKIFRGYDPVAVDAFLELASEEMGTLVTRINALEERILGMNATLDDYRHMEQALKDTMLSAQRLADDAKSGAQRDADLLKREARLEADQIVADAERRRGSLEQRIQDLEARERTFIRKMKAYLDEHRQALDAHDVEAPATTAERPGG